MSRELTCECTNHDLFTVGSKVTSRVTTQGLEDGRSYTVEAVICHRNVLGTFLTVAVRDGEQVCYVSNPTLLFREHG